MNNTKQIIKELQAAQTFLIREHKLEFALDNIRRVISLLKKSNAIDKCNCCDCLNSFINPFDELFCTLHKSTKLCEDFKKKKNV